MRNVYFDLTEELNADGTIAILASGQVVGIEPLIRMKQTQRAKDYPIIGELARLLPPEREIEWTTDPDRVIELAPTFGANSNRPAVNSARQGGSRGDVVVALAREVDRLQLEDKARLEKYRVAGLSYLQEFQSARIAELPLSEAHERICEIAERVLLQAPLSEKG